MSGKPVTGVDLAQGYLAYRDEIDAAVRRVLESGWYILGREVETFETAFADWCGAAHAVGVGSGTDAIAVALRAVGIGQGDAVFTVSHTAVATVAAIELTGAVPILVDISPDTLTLDPARLADAVLSARRAPAGPRPKAVVAVHLYGHPCDIEAIRRICTEHELHLIEDCAQAHGATLNGRRVGTFGDAACFSFYPTKNLGAFGDAGAIVTSDAAIASRCRALRQYGWLQRNESVLPGMNSRLDELHAAILGVRLRHLDAELASRRAIARRYDSGLAGVMHLPVVRAACEHAYHLYVVRTPNRDDIADGLRTRDIAAAVHYRLAVHQQKAYRGRIPIGPGGLQVTERVVNEVLSLPLHPFLGNEEIESVIAAVEAAAC